MKCTRLLPCSYFIACTRNFRFFSNVGSTIVWVILPQLEQVSFLSGENITPGILKVSSAILPKKWRLIFNIRNVCRKFFKHVSWLFRIYLPTARNYGIERVFRINSHYYVIIKDVLRTSIIEIISIVYLHLECLCSSLFCDNQLSNISLP